MKGVLNGVLPGVFGGVWPPVGGDHDHGNGTAYAGHCEPPTPGVIDHYTNLDHYTNTEHYDD